MHEPRARIGSMGVFLKKRLSVSKTDFSQNQDMSPSSSKLFLVCSLRLFWPPHSVVSMWVTLVEILKKIGILSYFSDSEEFLNMGRPAPLMYWDGISGRRNRTTALGSVIFTGEGQNLWEARALELIVMWHRWYLPDQNFDIGDSTQEKFLVKIWAKFPRFSILLMQNPFLVTSSGVSSRYDLTLEIDAQIGLEHRALFPRCFGTKLAPIDHKT